MEKIEIGGGVKWEQTSRSFSSEGLVGKLKTASAALSNSGDVGSLGSIFGGIVSYGLWIFGRFWCGFW